MDRLRTMHDADLHGAIRRLKRDVEDFRARAAKEASAVKRDGRDTIGDPLHQRLASIRDYLSEDLRHAESELARRMRAAARRPAWSWREAVAGLIGARG